MDDPFNVEAQVVSTIMLGCEQDERAGADSRSHEVLDPRYSSQCSLSNLLSANNVAEEGDEEARWLVVRMEMRDGLLGDVDLVPSLADPESMWNLVNTYGMILSDLVSERTIIWYFDGWFES